MAYVTALAGPATAWLMLGCAVQPGAVQPGAATGSADLRYQNPIAVHATCYLEGDAEYLQGREGWRASGTRFRYTFTSLDARRDEVELGVSWKEAVPAAMAAAPVSGEAERTRVTLSRVPNRQYESTCRHYRAQTGTGNFVHLIFRCSAAQLTANGLLPLHLPVVHGMYQLPGPGRVVESAAGTSSAPKPAAHHTPEGPWIVHVGMRHSGGKWAGFQVLTDGGDQGLTCAGGRRAVASMLVTDRSIAWPNSTPLDKRPMYDSYASFSIHRLTNFDDSIPDRCWYLNPKLPNPVRRRLFTGPPLALTHEDVRELVRRAEVLTPEGGVRDGDVARAARLSQAAWAPALGLSLWGLNDCGMALTLLASPKKGQALVPSAVCALGVWGVVEGLAGLDRNQRAVGAIHLSYGSAPIKRDFVHPFIENHAVGDSEHQRILAAIRNLHGDGRRVGNPCPDPKEKGPDGESRLAAWIAQGVQEPVVEAPSAAQPPADEFDTQPFSGWDPGPAPRLP